MAERKTIVYPNPEVLAQAVAARTLLTIIDLLAEPDRQRVDIAVTGGTDGIYVLKVMGESPLADAVDWRRVHVLGSEPALDIAMFGVGPDAHFASLFPDHGEVEIDDPHVLVAGVRDSPKPPPLRVTLTVPMIARSKHTWVFTSETRKADAVKAAFAQRDNPHAPSSYADGEELLWLIDEGAASKL